MKNTIHNQKGFTLVELILCIAIVGMLTAAIAPNFGNLLANSTAISGKGTAGALQSAINTKMGENILNGSANLWPTSLDASANGACNTLTDGCFGFVTAQPIRDEAWSKVSPTMYSFSRNGITQTYSYDMTNGQLLCISGC